MAIKQKKLVNKRYIRNYRNGRRTSVLSSHFSSDKIHESVKQLECGKAPGRHNIFPDYQINLSPRAIKWLARFLSSPHINPFNYQKRGGRLELLLF